MSRRRCAGALALSGLFGMAVACAANPSVQPHRLGATTARAAADLAAVTLTGDVTRTFGRYVIQLGAVANEPVLVVLPTPISYESGTRLTVSGRIEILERSAIEAALDIRLGTEVEKLAGAPCLLAEKVWML